MADYVIRTGNEWPQKIPTGSGGAVDLPVLDSGLLIGIAQQINFTGAGVTVTVDGGNPDQINIDIPGGGGPISLQAAYNGGNTITLAPATPIIATLDAVATATDPALSLVNSTVTTDPDRVQNSPSLHLEGRMFANATTDKSMAWDVFVEPATLGYAAGHYASSQLRFNSYLAGALSGSFLIREDTNDYGAGTMSAGMPGGPGITYYQPAGGIFIFSTDMNSPTASAIAGLRGGTAFYPGADLALDLGYNTTRWNNLWASYADLRKDALGTATTTGLLLRNTTAATLAVQQYSPLLAMSGTGWDSIGAASMQADLAFQARTVAAPGAPTVELWLTQSINAAAHAAVLGIGRGGKIWGPSDTGIVNLSQANKVILDSGAAYFEVSTNLRCGGDITTNATNDTWSMGASAFRFLELFVGTVNGGDGSLSIKTNKPGTAVDGPDITIVPGDGGDGGGAPAADGGDLRLDVGAKGLGTPDGVPGTLSIGDVNALDIILGNASTFTVATGRINARYALTVETDTYAATLEDQYIIANKGTPMDVDLPSGATAALGRVYTIGNIGAGTCSVDPDGTDEIDNLGAGVAWDLLQWESVTLVWTGTIWKSV